MKKYIAIDLGASNGRVIVGDLCGFTVTNRFVTRNDKVGGHIYWDILYIFSQIKKGIKEAFSLYPGEGEIAGISIDTWGVDYGLLNAAGNLISMPYHYRDSRTDGMMEEVFAKVPAREIYATTGIQFMQLNTIFQLAAMRSVEPELLQAARHYLSIPDLLSYWLCGVMANEFSHATTTQLFNPESGDWAWGLIEKLDLNPGMFGRIVPSGTVLGSLRDDVAAEVGAVGAVPVIACGSHDTASAVAAVPSMEEGNYLYLSSGTWSLLGIESDTPYITQKSLEYNFTNEGAANGRIRFLKNIMGMWIQQESLRSWEAGGETITFAELDAETLECAGFTGVIDPNDGRFLKPNSEGDSMPERICSYCREHDMPVPVRKGEYMVAIYRGLAQAYARYADQIEVITGTHYSHIYIIGGGSRNTIMNQWTADAAARTVSAGPVEATALGNIMLQALATGDLASLQEGRALIRTYHDFSSYQPNC